MFGGGGGGGGGIVQSYFQFKARDRVLFRDTHLGELTKFIHTGSILIIIKCLQTYKYMHMATEMKYLPVFSHFSTPLVINTLQCRHKCIYQ